MSFPVFRLTTKKPLEDNGVLYYKNSYLDVDSATIHHNVRLLDDKNLPGSTLALRRLSLKSQNVPLVPIRTAIYFLGDFIKLAKSNYWFIDNNGLVFTYKKCLRAKLVYRKISRVLESTTTGSVLEVQGLPERFKTLFKVPQYHKYAAFIMYKGLTILYGTTETQSKDSWRLI